MHWCESLATTREYELEPGESAAKAQQFAEDSRAVDQRARLAASWLAWRDDRDAMAATLPWHVPAAVPSQQPQQHAPGGTDITEPQRLVARNRTQVSARYGDESYIPASPAEPPEVRPGPADADADAARVLRWDAAGTCAKFQSPGVVCRELVRACPRTRTVHS